MSTLAPKDKMAVNSSQQDKPLQEKDFIQENRIFSGFPVWLIIFILSLFIFSLTGTYNWYLGQMDKKKSTEPFLEVTNRQFSIFLWQFPNFLRINSASKTGYLPGFEANEEGLKLSSAEEDVIAPPDLIFLYQTWKRLLASEYIPRPISPDLFDEFLNQVEAWLPAAWEEAPGPYKKMIKSQAYQNLKDLQVLSEAELPLIVRQSFQGWKNYFKEGPQINALNPSANEVKIFLKKYPTFSRSYWRNISQTAKHQIAGETYLIDLLSTSENPHSFLPKDQLSSFLRVALYNYQQSHLNN